MTEETTSRLDAALGSCFNSGPVPEEAITKAQAKLGLLFLPCYRIFLSRFGASLVKGFEVHGLDPNLKAGEMPQWSDVVESTLWLRPDCLPENTIEISHDGMGNGYCLKCSEADPQYDGPVIEWVPEHNGGKEVFASFLEFIEEHCSP